MDPIAQTREEVRRPPNRKLKARRALRAVFPVELRAAEPQVARAARKLIRPLSEIYDQMLACEQAHRGGISPVHGKYSASALNLLQYMVLRRNDLSPVQPRLAELGLSSLGRSEAHVACSVRSVLVALHAMAGLPAPDAPADVLSFQDGNALLKRHANALLGESPVARDTRIMVTMPSQAADDYALVRNLVAGGMNVMRINCAHDGPVQWKRMRANMRRACRETGRPCALMMDLAGPKLRTGPMEPGDGVVKLSPRRDLRGQVLSNARLLLVSGRPGGKLPPPDAVLRVPREVMRKLGKGRVVRLHDLRDSARELHCTQTGRGWRLLETAKTCYLGDGVELELPGGSYHRISGVPRAPGELTLHVGDYLALTARPNPGRWERRELDGEPRPVATVPCTLPQALPQVKVGEPVWLDDGKIGATVCEAGEDELLLQVTHAREDGARLGADKGINLPVSALDLEALTDKDIEDLKFVARNADLIGLSFVNRPQDVLDLQRELAALGARKPGIVLKIETRRAFADLPAILLAALRSYPVGVMIARGDLAVECGFERMAEVQEEILWICEAAHAPVIWATQVLETLAKKGAPTRAEITDAAMGERAECVMLNKGPHIAKAVSTLDNILRRMQSHQDKKSPRLRLLHVAEHAQAHDSD